jgi:hypothetical protein
MDGSQNAGVVLVAGALQHFFAQPFAQTAFEVPQACVPPMRLFPTVVAAFGFFFFPPPPPPPKTAVEADHSSAKSS